MPGLAEDEASLVVHVRGRHPVIQAEPGPGMDQVQLGHDRQGLEQRVGHQADLGTEPAQDPTDLLRLAGTEIRELSRLFRDRGRLDVDRLVRGTAALNRALQLAPMVLGHGQNVVMADHREVGVAEDPLDLGRSQHPAERFLDLFLGLTDLASQHRQPAARGVQHLGPAVEAALDGGGHAGEFPHALAQASQPGKLFTDPRQPAVEAAQRPERLGGLGQLFGLQHGADCARRTSRGYRADHPAEGKGRSDGPRPSRS